MMVSGSVIIMSTGYRPSLLQSQPMNQNQRYVVTTVTGGKASNEPMDGTRTQASFTSNLQHITIDGTGNLYVNDARALRKVSPDGAVETLYGTNIYTPNGPKKVPMLTSLVFDGLMLDLVAMVFDKTSNTIVMSAEDKGIYRWSPTQKLTLFTGASQENAFNESANGDGGPRESIFRMPLDMATDHAGNFYVNDGYRMVRRITAGGRVITIAGKVMDLMSRSVDDIRYMPGTRQDATLSNIGGVAADSKGNVFVSQPNIHCIVKITPAGVISTFAGTPSGEGQTKDGLGLSARFFSPGGMTIDRSDNLYVADKRKVRKITPLGMVTTIAGQASDDEDWWQPGFKDGDGAVALFTLLKGITSDHAGNIYVIDESRIRKLSPQ